MTRLECFPWSRWLNRVLSSKPLKRQAGAGQLGIKTLQLLQIKASGIVWLSRAATVSFLIGHLRNRWICWSDHMGACFLLRGEGMPCGSQCRREDTHRRFIVALPQTRGSGRDAACKNYLLCSGLPIRECAGAVKPAGYSSMDTSSKHPSLSGGRT